MVLVPLTFMDLWAWLARHRPIAKGRLISLIGIYMTALLLTVQPCCPSSMHQFPLWFLGHHQPPCSVELSSCDSHTPSPPNLNPSGLGESVTGLGAIPADKVCSGSYVDMKELLGDNISLLSQLEGLNISATLPAHPDSMKSRLREVSSLVQ